MCNMDVKEAWKKAKASEDKFGLKLKKKAWDDGEFFIFDFVGDDDLSPIAVNKKTGIVDVYFPFDHPEFKNAKRVL